MYWVVSEVKPIKNLTLYVRFKDGTAGKITFMPQFFTGVFEPLNDPAFFSQVFIVHDAVAWPNEIDLAPDAMYHRIKKYGEWILQ